MVAKQDTLRIVINEHEGMDVLGSEPRPWDRLAGSPLLEQQDDADRDGDDANRRDADRWRQPPRANLLRCGLPP